MGNLEKNYGMKILIVDFCFIVHLASVILKKTEYRANDFPFTYKRA